MNAAQIHLAINHVPVVLSAVSLVFLALGFFRRNESQSRSGLGLVIAAGLFAIPAFLTGEPAETVIEGLGQSVRPYIHAHEESAEVALILIEASALAAIVGFYALKKRPELVRKVLSLALVLNLLVFAKLAQVAHQGGLIRHTEIRSDDSSLQDDDFSGEASETDDEDGEYDVTQDPGHGEV